MKKKTLPISKTAYGYAVITIKQKDSTPLDWKTFKTRKEATTYKKMLK